MADLVLRDEWVEAAAAALTGEGAGPGNSIHSWRCEYPDRYGPCDCVRETAEVVLAAVVPLIKAQGWQEGFDAGADMAHKWGHVDYWEDEPSNPYVARGAVSSIEEGQDG